MIRFDPEKRLLELGVGDLVRHGGPVAIRAAPYQRSRLEAGVAEHRAWQCDPETAGERDGFRAEVAVRHELELDGYRVRLEGRIDGLHRSGDGWVVEEVKTVVVPPERFDGEALRDAVLSGASYAEYRLQVETYVLMVAAGGGGTPSGERVRGRLVFRNLAAHGEAREEIVDLEPDLGAVASEVRARARAILEECLEREARRQRLGALAGDIPFPHPSYRPHQDELAATVEETLERGEHLLISAPAGSGKTAAVLHAALRHALPRGKRIFWATAKTTQQRVVTATLDLLLRRWSEGSAGEERLPLRAVVLRAREKLCLTLREGGVVFCHDEYCRFAADYSRKVEAHGIATRLRELPVVTPDVVLETGEAAVVCPYELALDVVPECDLVVGDYNYVFDPASALRRFAPEELFADAVLVIDEAHNLLSRGREYWSPSVEASSLVAFREWAATHAGSLLERLLAFADRCEEVLSDAADAGGGEESETLPVELDARDLVELEREAGALRTAMLLEGPAIAASPDDPLERLGNELRRLSESPRLAEDGVPIVAFLDRRRASERIRAVCLDPSRPLADRMARFSSVVAMSATIEPLEFFEDVLGFPRQRTRRVRFPSPFPRENRGVFIEPRIATTFRRRARDSARIPELVDAIRAGRPGNYLVFLSSHEYLREVVAHIDPARIGRDIIVQRRVTDEDERDRVLETLREPGSARVLYGVQGGIFSEGVDYPGGMAIGVIVVGPGLPRFCVEEELAREHFEEVYEQGFEYAYLYPGMHRVLQAAGRLIRTPDDVGVIVLVGERFADSRYARLLPEDWYGASWRELVVDDVPAAVRRFWSTR